MPALPLDEAGKYVAAAYLVFLALLLIYLAIMAARLQRVDRELAELAELAERRREAERPGSEEDRSATDPDPSGREAEDVSGLGSSRG